MTGPIRPALTSGQWQDVLSVDPHGEIFLERLLLTVPGARKSEPIDGNRRHALAALALYGQPYGFTWEDVEWIRGAGEDMGTFAAEAFGNDLAARIAALLPPREETP